MPASPMPASPASPQKQFVVESGPVTPAAASDVEDYEDFDDESESQHEEKILSARELLSQHTGEDGDTDQGFQYEEEEEYY